MLLQPNDIRHRHHHQQHNDLDDENIWRRNIRTSRSSFAQALPEAIEEVSGPDVVAMALVLVAMFVPIALQITGLTRRVCSS